MNKCKAELHIADDYNDNHATMVCELHEDHSGSHRETFTRHKKPVVVTFEGDDREQDQPQPMPRSI